MMMVNNEVLKNLSLEDVKRNIPMYREGIVEVKGYTLEYTIDDMGELWVSYANDPYGWYDEFEEE